MNKLLFLCIMIFMVGCGSTAHTVSTASIDTKASFQFSAPAKQMLANFEWDYPRLADFATITNSGECIDAAKVLKMDRKARYAVTDLDVLPRGCATPAVDYNSNLYIGLTDGDYRNLVNNYNIFLVREKRWQEKLKSINQKLAK